MDKRETYELLKSRGVAFEVTEHKAVFNMNEMSEVEIPYPEADAKSLFVRDAKRREYCLITVRGDRRVDLKEFRRANGTRSLSFASEDELRDILGLLPGSVTPLGVLNDAEVRVKVYFDAAFLDPPGLIGVHPNDNTATVFMKTADLIDLIKDHGNVVCVVRL